MIHDRLEILTYSFLRRVRHEIPELEGSSKSVTVEANGHDDKLRDVLSWK